MTLQQVKNIASTREKDILLKIISSCQKGREFEDAIIHAFGEREHSLSSDHWKDWDSEANGLVEDFFSHTESDCLGCAISYPNEQI